VPYLCPVIAAALLLLVMKLCIILAGVVLVLRRPNQLATLRELESKVNLGRVSSTCQQFDCSQLGCRFGWSSCHGSCDDLSPCMLARTGQSAGHQQQLAAPLSVPRCCAKLT
jgi:hypothetical protein